LKKELVFGKQKIVYYEEGTGFPFLVLHGWGTRHSPDRNEGFIKELASKGFRVIQVTLPGFGDSSLPDIKTKEDELTKSIMKIMDRLEIGQVLVYGHSAGGLIAAKLAKMNPQRFKVIVLHSVPCPNQVKLLTQLGVFGVVGYLVFAGLWYLIPPILFLKPVRQLFKSQYEFFSRKKNAMGKAWKRFVSKNFDESLSYIITSPTPTLVMIGEKDIFLFKRGMEFFQQKPNSVCEILPEVGHKAPQLQPEIVVGKIMTFIKNNYSKLQKEVEGFNLVF
jgi:pimeloyl-ACP methyl ester carboxylesterase